MKNILDFEDFVNESYNKPRAGGKKRWSVKYKKSINCSNPKVLARNNIVKENVKVVQVNKKY
jgi:hypothetical protein